jgi:SAM-dependent methyltransferase
VKAPPLSLNAWLRWDMTSRMIRSFGEVASVLEIGAGLGGAGVRLAREYDYVGLEPDPTSFGVAARRLERLGRGTVVLTDDLSAVDSRRFDVVAAFEVLEHIEDDAGALVRWTERLRPGGHVLLSVPAWQERFGSADVRVGHFRRYDRATLVELLVDAGLEDVRVVAYGFPLGFALQPIWNLLARRDSQRSQTEQTAASGRWFQPPDHLAALTWLAAAPFRVLQRPFARTTLATGWVASGRKPPDR